MWYSLPFALLFMGAFAVDMTKVELSWAQKELGAFCLDGSAPIYYIYRGRFCREVELPSKVLAQVPRSGIFTTKVEVGAPAWRIATNALKVSH